jgi:two-component system, response regulator
LKKEDGLTFDFLQPWYKSVFMDQSHLQILLVEDNIDDASIALRALKKCNLANNLVHLPDGAEALDFLFARGNYAGRNVNNTPRVIMLDLKMPKVNGLEVLRAIKNDERTKSIPVVVMTSSQEEPDIREAYKLGVNSYIVKPIRFEDFVKAVSHLGMYWVLINQSAK